MVKIVARGFGDLNERMVFLGGAVTSLLVTDPALPHIRTTFDVDVIVEVLSRMDYYRLEDALRERGFIQRIDSDHPVCRWSLHEVIVDIMPTDEKILGFSNRWYAEAIRNAEVVGIDEDLEIRLVAAPFFLATKIEAFAGRGGGDFLSSHDIEDMISIINGRTELVSEVEQSSPKLRNFLSETFQSFLADDAFLESVPGHLLPDPANQARYSIVLARITKIVNISKP
ncbi:MAG: nucleotidyltransferase family protein [Deltaproteobacteria bacterium]|nr:nucleotidyltransferase family protein [Deltaproteobacteria bacterium]